MQVIYKKKTVDDEYEIFTDLESILTFMRKNDLKLTIDMFTFNPKIKIQKHLWKKTWEKAIVNSDISNEYEILPIPAINLVDEDVPQLNEYVMHSVFGSGQKHYKRVYVCCDCKDNCMNKLKCKCFLETLNRYDPDLRSSKKDTNIGYYYKTLPKDRKNLSGIYECNEKCSCNQTCNNRVVQFPTKWRFVIIKNEQLKDKGWSVLTLNDIPAGHFVANYNGEMFEEEKAEMMLAENWKYTDQWKYWVNLQVIQNANALSSKKIKLETTTAKPMSLDEYLDSSIKVGVLDYHKILNIPEKYRPKVRKDLKEKFGYEILPKHHIQCKKDLEKRRLKSLSRLAKKREEIKELLVEKLNKAYLARHRAWARKLHPLRSINPNATPSENYQAELNLVDRINQWPKVLLTDIKDDLAQYKLSKQGDKNLTELPHTSSAVKAKANKNRRKGRKPRGGITKSTGAEDSTSKPIVSSQKTETSILDVSLNCDKGNTTLPKRETSLDESDVSNENSRSNGKYSLRGNAAKSYKFDEDPSIRYIRKSCKREKPSVKFNEDVHFVDGRLIGNIGRFFNHSCEPNMITQYVFVDTHDVRFPVVSFFAARDIKAGEELTWCYNYDEDDFQPDPSRVVACLCNSKKCTRTLI